METVSIPNQALCVSGLDKLDIRPWPLELPASQGKYIVPEGNVLIKIRATGICGSDVRTTLCSD
jgi:threonine dehydrogenase-like Zn-dependent dehydrogenase